MFQINKPPIEASYEYMSLHPLDLVFWYLILSPFGGYTNYNHLGPPSNEV